MRDACRLLACPVVVLLFASAVPGDEIDLFTSGKEGYRCFRIPAMVVSNRGAVLAFCEGRKHGCSDTGDIDTVLKRSLDGGKTWLPIQVVWDDGPNVCGNPCPVVDRQTGTIWLLSTHNLAEDHEGRIWAGTGKGTRTVWVSKSTDDGETWSKPGEITPSTKPPEWTWYATGPGVGIQLQQEPHQGRLVIPCDHGVAGGRDYHSHVIYSDDHGQTWKLGGSVPDKTTSECQVVELVDGTLHLNIRNHFRRTYRRAISLSKDGGSTWSDPYHDPLLITPHCQGSVLRYTRKPQHEKNRLLFSNPASTKGRANMTVRLSYDEGTTWAVSKTIHAGPAAYSCLAVLPDGSIACFYEGGEKSPYERINFARFTLQELTDGEDQL